jgi:DNA-binding transcriptional ArsR family regulator
LARKEEKLDDIFSALSDSTRRKILSILSENDSSVSEIAKPFKMTLPAVMKHLRILEAVGLVVMDKEGRVRRCLFNPAPLSQITQWIGEHEGHWKRAMKSMEGLLHKETK